MQGKVIIITGSSSGIGMATAREFVKMGSKVVLAARSIEKLEALASELSINGNVLAVKTDVSIESDCKNLIDKTIAQFGQIDVLINNAGRSMRAAFKDVDLVVLKQLMDVNFWGTVYCSKYALPHILKTNGTIVGVSSIAGFVALPGRTGYSASKFAMHGFLKTLRAENFKTGLNVLIVAPGYTATNVRYAALDATGKPQGASPRNEKQMMRAEVVAKRIYSAIVKRRKTVVLTFFQGILTVALNKIFPRFIERMAYNTMAKEPNSPFTN